ncbi:hypothetical protein IV417_15285 [Alphaproteobacteria bacterium KMM 3653]|uniref:Secreted protein n=1 Tax=Harenicola maris TaxID=2841044 RepID=A0AAP2G992_9RHOB|nr:hypothetical protein [Harenicola maris]
MKKFFAASALIVASLQAAPVLAQDGSHVRPSETYVGQWYTTEGGCSYSRAMAPGYGTMWVLIINPHHINRPVAKASCPTTL